jgi:hypothetical protein
LPSRVLLALAVAGAVAVVLVAGGDERELAFHTGARPLVGITSIEPGGEACQTGLEATAEFSAVELRPNTGPEPGPPLAVSVRARGGGEAAGGGREVARGRLGAGTRDDRPARVGLRPEVPQGTRFDLCFRNVGARPVAFYGGPSGSDAIGAAYLDGKRVDGDMHLVFLRPEPRSALSLLPEMLERATLFKPGGAWLLWALLALVAAGVPLLLAAALRGALRDAGPGADRT